MFPNFFVNAGYITSGLELWSGEPCGRKYFRQRLWGSLSGAHTFFTDLDCYLKHLELDPITGSDPPNIRVRASQGFEAADYFMSAYWVWAKLIENFADVGYDASTMTLMSYDWRLAFPILEERDGFLTKLRFAIEALHKSRGEKVVLLAHSMGSSLVLYFLAWVTREEHLGGGGGGADWVDKHVHSFVNLAGTLLGTSKSAPALLSGEIKDTVSLLGPIGTVTERYFGRKRRKDLANTWGSVWSMLPKGGNTIWGAGADLQQSTDQNTSVPMHFVPLQSTQPAPIVSFTDSRSASNNPSCTLQQNTSIEHNNPKNNTYLHASHLQNIIQKFSSKTNRSIDEVIEFLEQWGNGYGSTLSAANLHSFKKKDQLTPDLWHDPTSTPLPYAPSLKIYCLYGVGIQTERAYFYKRNCGENGDLSGSNCDNTALNDPPFIIDASVNDPSRNIKKGILFADGDGSVPLLSTGYMCVDGWTRDTNGLNPSGVNITTREYKDKQEFQVDDPMRKGPESGDHVDILGNVHAMEDILKVVTGFEVETVTTHLESDILNITDRIRINLLGRSTVT
uniref:Phospholipid:diacylglycerol acyltransferase n=1 Tax=Ditylum brightwellii TaxID=49249 RepID=A0A6V2L6H5_9STRA|mmetsp:Transcript_21486/g.31733  ORF Transcript_21486/g.31733 Transcript_21486/m.31733 type:complete len:563 (-) Transcript_21486:711-2399(-)